MLQMCTQQSRSKVGLCRSRALEKVHRKSNLRFGKLWNRNTIRIGHWPWVSDHELEMSVAGVGLSCLWLALLQQA